MDEDDSTSVVSDGDSGGMRSYADAAGPVVGSRLEYAEIGYRVQGAAFDVYRGLGPGFLESVYEQAMLAELQVRGLRVARQVPVAVHCKHRRVGRHFADSVVEGVAVVELKAQVELSREAVPQVLNYLRASRLPLASLINFARVNACDLAASSASQKPTLQPLTVRQQGPARSAPALPPS